MTSGLSSILGSRLSDFGFTKTEELFISEDDCLEDGCLKQLRILI